MNKAEYAKYMKGTTTVGIICSDGVVMGADMRSTMGDFVNNTSVRKVFRIDDNLVLTVAGSVGDAQEIIRILRAHSEVYKMSENHPMSPKSAASLLSIILQQNKMMPYYVQLMIGGLDGSESELYSMDPIGGYSDESKYVVTGAGTEMATGYLDDAYKKGIGTKEGVKLASRALSIAMKRSASTGDGMIIAVVTKSGYTEYSGKDIEKIASQAK